MTELINPKNYSYAFRMGIYDCFKVLNGRCSLNLSEEEYRYLKPLTSSYKGEGSIDYCRELSLYLIENNLFVEDTGINMHQYNCGHVAFSDGQHRTCIAKKLGVNELNVSVFGKNEGYCCRVCHLRNINSQLSTIQKVWKTIKTNKREEAIHKEYIDDELSGSYLKTKSKLK